MSARVDGDPLSILNSDWERKIVCWCYRLGGEQRATLELLEILPSERREALEKSLTTLKLLPPLWADELVSGEIGPLRKDESTHRQRG